MNYNNLIAIPLCIVEQGGNAFYFGKMKASDLISIFTVHPATYDALKTAGLNADAEAIELRFNQRITDLETGVMSSDSGQQRRLNLERKKEIANYLNDSKNFAIFPNAIIATCDLYSDLGESLDDFKQLVQKPETIGAYLDKTETVGENFLHTHTLYITKKTASLIIIDGQHRIEGIAASNINKENFEVLVTFILGVDRASIAKYFYTVNYYQKPVNKSLLYHLMGEFGTDLQEISYLHEIVIALNELDLSPFHNRIKMLGTKDRSVVLEDRAKMNLSQAFLIDYMKYMIIWNSAKKNQNRMPKLLPIFYWYYKNSDHVYILRFILRFFTAAQEAFPEIKNPESPFGKTLGIGAMLYFMSDFFVKLAYTRNLFDNPKHLDDIRSKELVPLLKGIEQVKSDDFPSSGAAGVGRLHKKFVELCVWLHEDNAQIPFEDMKFKFLQWVNMALKSG